MNDYNPTISIHEMQPGQKVPNITIEGAKFFGRPNFAGEKDRFNETSRQFTVIIPNDVADQIRDLGYNVKSTQPKKADGTPDLDADPIRHLKVKMAFTSAPKIDDPDFEHGPDVYLKSGNNDVVKLTSKTVGVIDRGRLTQVDVELRAWEWDPKDAPGQFSARLNQAYIEKPASIIGDKIGNLGV